MRCTMYLFEIKYYNCLRLKYFLVVLLVFLATLGVG